MTRTLIKEYVTFIIKEKAQGNTFQEMNVSMKLMLKGIPANKILDDNDSINIDGLEEKIFQAAKELNVTLPNLV